MAIASIDRHSLGLEEYVVKCEKAKGTVEQTFRDRAYKMLTIANPNNGDGFFQLILNYDWSKKGMVVLTKENLYTLATCGIRVERKMEVLHTLMTRKEELIDEAETIVQRLSIYGDVPTDGFGKWVKEKLTMHVWWSFHEVWKYLFKVKEVEKQPGVEEAAKRVVYMYIVIHNFTLEHHS
ncbi:hypothetical protein GOP47_0024382 [Adiantum capillus-veneris]|uniref:Uncharacterized protein n=1 Tax=Adiantum capillus-veneris TaxID=13818 RepID=A0A9D4Z4C1_ADICA|nr:hypothetical protein GOP47_0024382 [Adiantum capillus-veneris]